MRVVLYISKIAEGCVLCEPRLCMCIRCVQYSKCRSIATLFNLCKKLPPQVTPSLLIVYHVGSDRHAELVIVLVYKYHHIHLHSTKCHQNSAKLQGDRVVHRHVCQTIHLPHFSTSLYFFTFTVKVVTLVHKGVSQS